MSRYSEEEKQEILRTQRELLDDARSPYELAGADILEVEPWSGWETESERNDRLYRYGIPLRDPHALEKWRADIEAQERRFEQEREAERAEERRIMRERQRDQRTELYSVIDAKIDAALAEFGEALADPMGEVVALERGLMRRYVAEQLGQLRAESSSAKAHTPKSGEIMDPPALPLIRKPNSYAA
jgi:hypothetical protein